jgi:hypothetical protein
MEPYLVDTDVIIDHLRGEQKARDFLVRAMTEDSQILYSVITKAELYAGLRPGEEESVQRLLNSMEEVGINGKIAETGGKYKREFGASHGLLLPDALVAACAKQTGATLITLNRKNYPMSDIKIQVPYRKS